MVLGNVAEYLNKHPLRLELKRFKSKMSFLGNIWLSSTCKNLSLMFGSSKNIPSGS